MPKPRELTERPRSTREVNAMIRRLRNADAGLVQGNGYLYFTNDYLFDNLGSTSVAVCYVSQLTLAAWLDEYDRFVADAGKN